MDNGGEFIRNHLLEWFIDSYIMTKYSLPYYSESNERAERLNRTQFDKARVIINCLSPAQKNLWAEAIDTENYIRNRSFR